MHNINQPAINLPAASAEHVSGDAMHTDMVFANTSHTCTRLVVTNETMFELASFARLIGQSWSKNHIKQRADKVQSGIQTRQQTVCASAWIPCECISFQLVTLVAGHKMQ